MADNRTELQKAADEFDMKLYRLIMAADGMAGRERPGTHARNTWLEINAQLRIARRPVRGMMHADDRARTQ